MPSLVGSEMCIRDSGNVTVADLHTYFETIGLPSGIEEAPAEPEPEPEEDEFDNLSQELEEEARKQAEEIIRQQEAEKQRLIEEQQAKEAAELKAAEQARREEEAAKSKPEPILLEEDGTVVSHERFIQQLGDMKLSVNAVMQSRIHQHSHVKYTSSLSRKPLLGKDR